MRVFQRGPQEGRTRRPGLAHALFLAAFCGGPLGCASSPALRAAERGDRAGLRSAVQAREKAATLSNHEAASLALAVARHDLLSASGSDALDRVHDAWSCAHELDGALAERMRTHDDAGAEAALARLDGRGLEVHDLRRYLADTEPSWRAAGTRALVGPEDHAAREQALLDPDPHVRRQAARAAREAADPHDLESLAEVARVDPEPLVRTEAVRAIAMLAPLPGEGAANALRDLWTGGDDGLREDIALAWAGPALWNAGGRQALLVVVSSDHGPGAVEAAAAVLRHRDVDGQVGAAALAQLVRAIEQGAPATRQQAIAQAPFDRPELRAAMNDAAAADDEEVRVAALARLVEAKHAGTVEKLEAYAQPGSPVGRRARFALASAGDLRVQAWIEQDLVSERPFDRLSAASALASLDASARAAPLLADDDASVRVRAACTLLVAARRR
jgi:HEAT repeat protein